MQTKATDFKLDTTSDLHRWRAFVAISELGSLTRAALFLDTNQSLLSRQLNKLERECGARLFNRTGRGVELSEVGERLFPQVKTLLANAETLEEQIHGNTREPSGQVTLGFLPSIALPMVGRLFSEVRKRYPEVNLKVLEGSSGQVEALLADARVDIAILYRYGTTTPENEHALALVDSYLIGAVGDSTTQAPEVPFSALDGLPFILPGAPNGLRTTLDAMARQRHMQLAPVIEADSLPLQKVPGGERAPVHRAAAACRLDRGARRAAAGVAHRRPAVPAHDLHGQRQVQRADARRIGRRRPDCRDRRRHGTGRHVAAG